MVDSVIVAEHLIMIIAAENEYRIVAAFHSRKDLPLELRLLSAD